MLTPEQLRKALNARGLHTLAPAAKALRVTEATVSRWLSGRHPIPDIVGLALEGLKGTPRAQKRSAKPSKSSK